MNQCVQQAPHAHRASAKRVSELKSGTVEGVESGIPFKVWGVAGGALGLNPLLVIPTFVMARGVRMAIFASIAGLLTRRFAGFVRDFSIFLLVIYLALFLYGLWQVTSLS